MYVFTFCSTLYFEQIYVRNSVGVLHLGRHALLDDYFQVINPIRVDKP